MSSSRRFVDRGAVRSRLTAVAALAALGTAAAVVGAETSTTQPSTAPATRPVAARPATGPTVVATAARPAAASPQVAASIHDLAARIRRSSFEQATAAALPKVAYFDLSSAVVEKPADFSLFGGDSSALTLRSLVERLHKARDDKSVRAVLMTLNGPGTNLSQSQEVRDALVECRRAGKKTFVYADGYDTDSYTIASGATNVCRVAR